MVSTVYFTLMSQTTAADELGGFDAPMVQQQHQQQNSAPQLQEAGPDQPSLSPEELLLAVGRIKQEPADTPPTEENRRAEEGRCVTDVWLPSPWNLL